MILNIHINMMLEHYRINDIYTVLQTILENSISSHDIIFNMPSENATISAYNGMYYTICNIVNNIKSLQNIKLENHYENDIYKTFLVYRNSFNLHIKTYIKIILEKNNKQLRFNFYNEIE